MAALAIIERSRRCALRHHHVTCSDSIRAGWSADYFNGPACRDIWCTRIGAEIMSITWWAVIGTSAAAFALKYLGQSIPEKFLSHPRIQRTNVLIPVALLSALVAVQTFTDKTTLAIDHRALGLGFALLALVLKAPFPIVVISAAASSAILYHFF